METGYNSLSLSLSLASDHVHGQLATAETSLRNKCVSSERKHPGCLQSRPAAGRLDKVATSNTQDGIVSRGTSGRRVLDRSAPPDSSSTFDYEGGRDRQKSVVPLRSYFCLAHPLVELLFKGKHSSGKKDSWADRLAKQQIRGWRACSAEGL